MAGGVVDGIILSIVSVGGRGRWGGGNSFAPVSNIPATMDFSSCYHNTIFYQGTAARKRNRELARNGELARHQNEDVRFVIPRKSVVTTIERT